MKRHGRIAKGSGSAVSASKSLPTDLGYAVTTVTMCPMVKNEQNKQKRRLISDPVYVKNPIVRLAPTQLGSRYCSMKQRICRGTFAGALSAAREKRRSSS